MIIEAVAEHVETFGSVRSLSFFAHENRILQCLAAIRDTRLLCSDYEAALWDLLTHELVICQGMLTGGVSTVHLRQHGATLSLMRGISSRMDSVNHDVPFAPSLSRAFSNATQQEWSQQLSQQVGTQSVPMDMPPLSLASGRPYQARFSSTNSMEETQDM